MRELLKQARHMGWLALLLIVSWSFLAGCATPASTAPNISTNQAPKAAAILPVPAPEGPFTVERAIERALVSSDQIAKLKAAVEVARQSRRAATDIQDPVIEADERAKSKNGSAIQDEWNDSRLRLDFYLPNPWLVVPRVNARTADLRAAEADLRGANWQVRCDVLQLFEEQDYLTNEVALAENLARLHEEILQVVRSRADHGAATSSELLTATRQYLQIQDDLDQARHRYGLAQRKLATLLKVPAESLCIAANSLIFLPHPPPKMTIDEAEKVAMQYRSDLAALHWRVIAAESAYRESRNVRVPWVKEVRAGYYDNLNSDTWLVGLEMDVPIFSWTKNHADDVVLAREKLMTANETSGMQIMRQEIRDAIDELEESRRQQARYDTDVAPLIATMRKTLATLQSASNTMPDQLAMVEVQISESMLLELGSRSRNRLAQLNLERVLGSPLDETVRSLSAP